MKASVENKKINEWTTNNEIIVVAGSANLERGGKFYNTSTIFFEGEPYKTEKHDLSPLEKSGDLGGRGPTEGTEQLYFENTPIGNIGVMICADEFKLETRNQFLELDLDILCVIAYQPQAKYHHQSLNQIVNDVESGIYIAYANAYCNGITDGQSAFFADDYEESISEATELGLIKNRDLRNKLIEQPHDTGALIVECKLESKKRIVGNRNPNRRLVNFEIPYIFSNGNLRQLSTEELKKQQEKSAKPKSEYQE